MVLILKHGKHYIQAFWQWHEMCYIAVQIIVFIINDSTFKNILIMD